MSSQVLEVEFKHNGERLLRMLHAQHPNYHPLISIAKIAHDAENLVDEEGRPNYEIALRAHQTVLRYVEPELKSVEVKVEKVDTRTINVRLFEDVKDVTDVSESNREALQAGDTGRKLLNDMVDRIIDAEVMGE